MSGVWEEAETAQKRDVDFYKEAGLDPAINKLHWFLCGFEGAVLARNSDMFPDYPLAQRQVIADRWFSAMFVRFKGHPRLTFESPLHGRSRKTVREIAEHRRGSCHFNSMLARNLRLDRAVFQGQGATLLRFLGRASLNKRRCRGCQRRGQKRAVERVARRLGAGVNAHETP